MRYLAIAFILMSYPGLFHLLKMYPRYRHWAYFFLGMLPFVVHIWNLDSAIINWGAWQGFSKGMILTIEDTLALAILTTQREPRGMPPLLGWVVPYILAVAFSIALAGVWMASFFYFFQLLRFAVILAAVAKIAADPRALKWLGMGLAAGMMYEVVVTVDQKLNGAFQTPGTMGHPNQLGMMVYFVVLPGIGMLLAGYRSRVLILGVASSLLVIVLCASRATIGFVALGIALVLLLSLRRRITPHKKRIVGLAVATMVVAAPFLLHSVSMRLAQQYEHSSEDGSDYDERAAFERSAEMIWKDYPMGVGANNYVMVANTQGYSARAGVSWMGGSRAASVHNTYLLVAAETGWVGLVTYVAMLGAFVVAGWRFAFKDRGDPRGDIALGATIAIAMMALHSRYEWITLTYNVQYVIAIAMGMISGLIRVQALERKQKYRGQPAPSARMFVPVGGPPAEAWQDHAAEAGVAPPQSGDRDKAPV